MEEDSKFSYEKETSRLAGMATFRFGSTTLKNKKGETIRIKKCSVPSVDAKQIYEALGYKTVPYYMKKSVLPEL